MGKKNTWDLPPPAPRGDVDAVAIYHAVGVASTWFEVLQTRLVWLFCALVQSDSLALKRALGTLESVPQKVQMAKYAAVVTLANHPELLRRVNDLLTEVEQFSHRRNDIVHAEVTNLTIDKVHLGHYLVPGDHVAKKNPLPPIDGEWWNYRLTSAQINAITNEFRRVGAAVEDLAKEIRTTLNQTAPAPSDTR